jgi:hypothetical protein
VRSTCSSVSDRTSSCDGGDDDDIGDGDDGDGDGDGDESNLDDGADGLAESMRRF